MLEYASSADKGKPRRPILGSWEADAWAAVLLVILSVWLVRSMTDGKIFEWFIDQSHAPNSSDVDPSRYR